MADKDYPFPAPRHEIIFQPAPPHIDSTFTLGDVISGKAILNFDNQETCHCGVVFELPEPMVEMAVRLAQTLPLDTPMMYGITHPFDETFTGQTEEEIVAEFNEWYEKYDKNKGPIKKLMEYIPYPG